MIRFTGERGVDKSESPSRKTRQQDRLLRWTDKVFVIPATVADAIAKLGTHSLFAPAAKPVDTPAPRRRRGFYVWRPSVGPDGKPYVLGGVVRLIEEIDPRTGEILAPRPQPKELS